MLNESRQGVMKVATLIRGIRFRWIGGSSGWI